MNKILISVLLLIACLRVNAQVADTIVAPPTVAEDIVDEDDSEETVAEVDTATIVPALRTVPEQVTDSLKRDKKFEYANDAAYWTHKEEEKRSGRSAGSYIDSFFSSEVVRSIGYVLMGALFLFVLYRLVVVNNLYLFRSKRSQAVTGETIEDIRDYDLDELLRNALQENNHRLATRYLYLKTLQLLNEKGWIRFHAQATNYDYINQVSLHGHAGEFRFLTRAYDYVWYGEFALNKEQFELVHERFRQFFKVLKP